MTKILLVEDHEELLDFLSRCLRKRGFKVVLAQDGAHALVQFEKEQPDLMLLDMDLLIMNGWSVARALRAGGNKLPISALTAHAMSGGKTRAVDTGCDEYHSKPVDFAGLIEQIDVVLLRCEKL